MEQVKTANILGLDSEMLECPCKDASGRLAYDSKPYIVVFELLKELAPSGVHLELWDQRVYLLPIDGLLLLQRSCDRCPEECFIEICNQTFNLSVHMFSVLKYSTEFSSKGYNAGRISPSVFAFRVTTSYFCRKNI